MKYLWIGLCLLLCALSAQAQRCYLDTPIPEWQRLLREDDPQAGNPEADLVVIEYFDPNCPHCQRFYPLLKGIISEYGLAARFVFKPIPLWNFSIDQVAALLEANRQGRFEALLELQYEHQRRGGLDRQTLIELASKAGLDVGRLQQVLDEKYFLARMLEDRQLAVQAGVRGVPTLIINGRILHHDYSYECLDRTIKQALNNHP